MTILVLILGFISYREIQREKNYLWELARSEGLNITYSIQALGSDFILNQDILKEVLDLFKKEGIAYIDIIDQQGNVRISSNDDRVRQKVKIVQEGRVNFVQIQDKDKRRILQVIKPFDSEERFSSDFFAYIYLKDKYLLVGINLENYYARFGQITQRILLNYVIIFILSLFVIYTFFRIQESLVVKKTLRDMKDYTSKLLETMDNGVISVNEKMIVKTFNRKSEQIFHKNRNEVLNKNAEKVLPIKIKDTSIYQLGMKDGKKIEQEMIYFDKEQHKKILDINTSLLSKENKKRGGMVILIRDITHLKSLSEEINRNKKLASLGQLASGIAHEIRNPLSSIRGLAQFLFQSFDQNDARRDDLNVILNEVDRLNKLITEILDFSRARKLHKYPFSLEILISDIIELLKPEINKKKIQIDVKIDRKITAIVADKDQLKQSLINIIINAIQAVSKNGKIWIILEQIIYQEKRSVKITIKDNGPGIKTKDQSNIFDPFFTTKDHGSGLGLSIAHQLIELHDGKINIYSKENNGTEVVINLPIGDRR